MMDKFLRSSGIGTTSGAQVLIVFLETIIQNLHEYVQGCVVEWVFDLDEVGISDWADNKTKKVVALAAMFGRTIHHGISRNVKYISVIACVWDARESLFHYIMISQNSPTVQKHLKKQAFVSAGISP
jgi:hypothetical protein